MEERGRVEGKERPARVGERSGSAIKVWVQPFSEQEKKKALRV